MLCRLHNSLTVEVDYLAASTPSVSHMFRVPGEEFSKQYHVVKGAYLALDLINTHLSRMHHHDYKQHRSTLVLLLHALVLSAPFRPSLHLPASLASNGYVELKPLDPNKLSEITGHADYKTRWKPSLDFFINNEDCRTALSLAASSYYDYNYWQRSLSAVGDQDNSEDNFVRWVNHSLAQISGLLAVSSVVLSSTKPHVLTFSHLPSIM